MMNKIIEIEKLVKRYDSKFELNIESLGIEGGMIIGLIGENGAGKTTFLKSLLNIIPVNHGDIKIFGKDIKLEGNFIKEEIGLVLDNMFFPEVLTPKDIDLVMRDVYKNWDSNIYDQYLSNFQLPKSKMIKNLSKGMRKKLEIATALSHHPKLLILDEATSGLDPVVRGEVLDIFLDFIQDENHTILFSTHITSDLEHIADYIVFLDKGKILLNQSRDEIMDGYGILKCDTDSFQEIAKEDIICYRKNSYDYEILVKDRDRMKKKYKKFVVDRVTIEKMMVLMIKGDRI